MPDGMWSHGGGRWGQALVTALGKQLWLQDHLGGRADPHTLDPCACDPAPPGSAFGGLSLALTRAGPAGKAGVRRPP